MLGNPTSTTFASYGEAVAYAVRDLGTATPHTQTLKLLAWLYDMPLSTVRRDCQEYWGRQRRQDNNRGGVTT